MATKKKTPSKKFSQKVHKIVKGDVFTSIAVASVLLNVLFFVTLFVLTGTDVFNYRLYTTARERYCTNVSAIRERAEELGSEAAALKELQIECVGEEFKPFYIEALEKYQAHTKQD